MTSYAPTGESNGVEDMFCLPDGRIICYPQANAGGKFSCDAAAESCVDDVGIAGYRYCAQK